MLDLHTLAEQEKEMFPEHQEASQVLQRVPCCSELQGTMRLQKTPGGDKVCGLMTFMRAPTAKAPGAERGQGDMDSKAPPLGGPEQATVSQF